MPQPENPSFGSAVRILTLSAGGNRYAVRADLVREVVPFRGATRLPGAPSHVAGLINLRGTVVTVVDLAVRLGLLAKGFDDRCIILLHGTVRPVGVVVDAVQEVCLVDDSSIEKPVGRDASELATGIVRRSGEVVLLLDLGLLARQALLI